MYFAIFNLLPLVSLFLGAAAEQDFEPVFVNGSIGQHLGLGYIEAADVSSLWSGLDDEARKKLEGVNIFPGKDPQDLVEDLLVLTYGGDHQGIDSADKRSTIVGVYNALGGQYAEFASGLH